ncbi:hypothetical protein BN2476_670051 [Paraburkholderia piptadeniae]|uniref:Uncharacterized protein n=1 Tax=Paraburkholderia piptadeniae TaxID=1701573 RepID=A0A1N7SNJ6_9BURK|nr:hypothetical protein BN2476_670051 [Paraburkholderia piptadeniae]
MQKQRIESLAFTRDSVEVHYQAEKIRHGTTNTRRHHSTHSSAISIA